MLEVIVAMGIAVITGGLLLVIIVNSTGLFTRQSAKIEEGVKINDAFTEVRNSIKQASAIANQYTAGAITYTSASNQLVLKVASIDSSGNIIVNTSDYFVFYIDQNYFRFKIFPDISSTRKSADRVLTNNVGSINFQYFNAANPPQEVLPVNAVKVKTTLILQQKAGAVYEQTTATSEANLRND